MVVQSKGARSVVESSTHAALAWCWKYAGSGQFGGAPRRMNISMAFGATPGTRRRAAAVALKATDTASRARSAW